MVREVLSGEELLTVNQHKRQLWDDGNVLHLYLDVTRYKKGH